jgi:hypothetical protein
MVAVDVWAIWLALFRKPRALVVEMGNLWETPGVFSASPESDANPNPNPCAGSNTSICSSTRLEFLFMFFSDLLYDVAV